MFQHDMKTIRGNKTLELLKEKAEYLFFSKNYDDVTINDICDACGMTKGAFYHHFKSKDELFCMLFAARENEFILKRIQQLQIDYPDNPAKQVVGWILASWTFALHSGKDNCRYQQRNMNMSFPMGIYQEFVHTQLNQLEFWQEKGMVRRDLSVRDLWEYIMSFNYGFFSLWCIDRGDFPPEERIYEFVNRCII